MKHLVKVLGLINHLPEHAEKYATKSTKCVLMLDVYDPIFTRHESTLTKGVISNLFKNIKGNIIKIKHPHIPSL